MLRSTIVAIVTRCTRQAWLVIALSTLLGVISGVYAVRHFAINTDINKLISPDLPWRQRELAFEKAFPQHLHSILAVVDAPTPELASQAAERAGGAAGGEQGADSQDHATGRRRILPPQRVVVSADRGGRKGRQAADPGRAADRPARDRPEPARPGRSAADGPDRRRAGKDHARQHGPPADRHGGHRRGGAGGQARELLLARAAQSLEAGRPGQQQAQVHRHPAQARFHRAGARQRGDRRDPQGRRGPEARDRLRRARAPHRPGARSRTRNSPPCRKAWWSTASRPS